MSQFTPSSVLPSPPPLFLFPAHFDAKICSEMPSIMLSETNEDYQGTRRIDRSRAQVPQARWLPLDAENAISFSRLVNFLSAVTRRFFATKIGNFRMIANSWSFFRALQARRSWFLNEPMVSSFIECGCLCNFITFYERGLKRKGEFVSFVKYCNDRSVIF